MQADSKIFFFVQHIKMPVSAARTELLSKIAAVKKEMTEALKEHNKVTLRAKYVEKKDLFKQLKALE
jgi:hypothetical protein